MSKRLILLACLLGFFGILSTGCGKGTVLPPIPDLGIPGEEINTRIHLETPSGVNTFKIGEIIGITVDIISGDQISFPTDYGAMIFMLEGQEWVEIPNLMKYPEGEYLLSPSGGDPLKKGAADVDPVLPDTNRPVLLRIVLIGSIYRNGQVTDDPAAAYIDVELTP